MAQKYDEEILFQGEGPNGLTLKVTREGAWTWLYYSATPEVKTVDRLQMMGASFSGRRSAWKFTRIITQIELTRLTEPYMPPPQEEDSVFEKELTGQAAEEFLAEVQGLVNMDEPAAEVKAIRSRAEPTDEMIVAAAEENMAAERRRKQSETDIDFGSIRVREVSRGPGTIKATKFVLSSECGLPLELYDNDKYETAIVTTWEAAARIVRYVEARRIAAAPDDITHPTWYHKTWASVEYEDGYIYEEARLDVTGADDGDIGAHILEHIAYHTGECKPEHLNEADYRHHLKVYETNTPGIAQELRDFRANYELVCFERTEGDEPMIETKLPTLPAGWTKGDIQYLLNALDKGPIIVADARLGLPSLSDIPTAGVTHLMDGYFKASTSEYELYFEGGGAMKRTPDGDFGWCHLDIKRGEFPYNTDAARALLQAWLVAPVEYPTEMVKEAVAILDATPDPEPTPVDPIEAFLIGKPANVQALIRKALAKEWRIGISNGSDVQTAQHYIESLFAIGKLKVATATEPAIKPMSRTRFNRADGAEQAEHERKMEEAGNKTIYLVGEIGGEWDGSELGKYAYDYAAYLLGQPESAPEAEQVVERKVTRFIRTQQAGFEEWYHRSEEHGELAYVGQGKKFSLFKRGNDGAWLPYVTGTGQKVEGGDKMCKLLLQQEFGTLCWDIMLGCKQNEEAHFSFHVEIAEPTKAEPEPVVVEAAPAEAPANESAKLYKLGGWDLWVETGGVKGIKKFAAEVNDPELLKFGHARVCRLTFSFAQDGLKIIERKLKTLGATL